MGWQRRGAAGAAGPQHRPHLPDGQGPIRLCSGSQVVPGTLVDTDQGGQAAGQNWVFCRSLVALRYWELVQTRMNAADKGDTTRAKVGSRRPWRGGGGGGGWLGPFLGWAHLGGLGMWLPGGTFSGRSQGLVQVLRERQREPEETQKHRDSEVRDPRNAARRGRGPACRPEALLGTQHTQPLRSPPNRRTEIPLPAASPAIDLRWLLWLRAGGAAGGGLSAGR